MLFIDCKTEEHNYGTSFSNKNEAEIVAKIV